MGDRFFVSTIRNTTCLTFALLFIGSMGCSNGNDSGGKGGSGSGGAGGGAPATGGATGSGGAKGSGGSPSTGGSMGSGGSSSTGGKTTTEASGGTGGKGGASVVGGSSARDGGMGNGGVIGGASGTGGRKVDGGPGGTGVTGGAGAGGTGPGGAGGGTITGAMPLVYETEFTGADCPKPTLADDPLKLPAITYLPDPFLMADGTRMTTREQWRCRRAEIKAILEKYDDGAKPGKPSTFNATLSGSTINITVGEGSNSFKMTAAISRPSGAASGAIPAIIGINGPTGSLPADVFSKRGIATITFTSDQIMANGFSAISRSDGNFAKIYPSNSAGSMVRWAWGISRIIDALEALPEAKIDTKHLAVSGCSYQGKIALFAGAYDERIALTIPHESGGGGTISWRYADKLDGPGDKEVEGLHHAQGAPWYAELLLKYQPDGVSPDTLPYDHHELIGMIAPRAVLAIESSQIYRMGAEAARVDALAAREIYKALGVPTRMGATEENTAHCTWHTGFTPDLEAYVDKFLLGKETNTDILRSKFTSVDRATWIPWTTPALQ
jgi:hypothetical protein